MNWNLKKKKTENLHGRDMNRIHVDRRRKKIHHRHHCWRQQENVDDFLFLLANEVGSRSEGKGRRVRGRKEDGIDGGGGRVREGRMRQSTMMMTNLMMVLMVMTAGDDGMVQIWELPCNRLILPVSQCQREELPWPVYYQT